MSNSSIYIDRVLITPAQDRTFGPDQWQVTAAAAGLSKLAYELDPRTVFESNAVESLRRLRECGLIDEVWLLERHNDASGSRAPQRAVLACAARPRPMAYLAFCGTSGPSDWHSRGTARPRPEEALGLLLHRGYADRASEWVDLAAYLVLVLRKRLVLCGHSLGGSVATALGLKLLGETGFAQFRDVWSTGAPEQALQRVQDTVMHFSKPWPSKQPRVSVITFGAPTVVLQEKNTHASPDDATLFRTHHHFMVSMDPVPFAYTHLRSLLRTTSLNLASNETLMRGLVELLVLPLHTIHPTVSFATRDALMLLLKWTIESLDSHTPSLHSGNLLISDGDSFTKVTNDDFRLRADLSATGLIQNADGPLSDGTFQQHAMDHYVRKVMVAARHHFPARIPARSSLDSALQFKQTLISSDMHCTMTGEQQADNFTFRITATPTSVGALALVRVENEGESPPLRYDLKRIEGTSTSVTYTFTHRVALESSGEEWPRLYGQLSTQMCAIDLFGERHVIPPFGIRTPPLREVMSPSPEDVFRTVLIHCQLHWLQQSFEDRPIGLHYREQAQYIDQILGRASPHLFITNLPRLWPLIVQAWKLTPATAQSYTPANPISAFVPKMHDQQMQNLFNGLISRMLDSNVERQMTALIRVRRQDSTEEPLSSYRRSQKDHEAKKIWKSWRSYPDGALRHVAMPSLVASLDEYGLKVARYGDLMRRCNDLREDEIALEDRLEDGAGESNGSLVAKINSARAELDATEAELAQAGIDLTTATATLQQTFVFLHSVFNTQLLAPSPWLFKRSFTARAHQRLLDALLHARLSQWPGSKFLSGNSTHDDYKPIFYERSLRLLVQACNLQPSDSIFALETRLSRTEMNFHALDFARDFAQRAYYRPSQFCLNHWIPFVRLSGDLRRKILPQHTIIGAVGPSRQGKSTLLTQLWSFPESVFGPGAEDRYRTCVSRTATPPRTTEVTVVDLPGLDEQLEAVRRETAQTFGILDVFVVVLSFSNVHTMGSVEQALRWVAQRIVERRLPPFRILLNKFDDTVEFREDPHSARYKDKLDKYVRTKIADIRDRKELIVSRLAEYLRDLGVNDQEVRSVVMLSAQGQEEGRRNMIVQRREKLADLVKATTLIPIAENWDPNVFTRPTFDVLSRLSPASASDPHVWTLGHVKEWLRSVCSDAFGP
ncbi:CGI-141-RELATED/LIPASE CONTAINING PROTEIN [Ceraceosorus bombacis]|uniref:CGI-141-RELATED/LIPASE CONTAINING PROTEIN n=1 Tax=Ceraceosorus bombacis TaxID=401625 RepID=A0A0P1BGD8_9BASI|nr:CGI-141-RELATED/LIPASE CONTAINING PROTEIN [Ceraceosorus bombacis]